MVFPGKVLNEKLVTYCCAQFVVKRERIIGTSLTETKSIYSRLDSLVRNSWYHKCDIENMPCYILEFFWHVVFGESEALPRR